MTGNPDGPPRRKPSSGARGKATPKHSEKPEGQPQESIQHVDSIKATGVSTSEGRGPRGAKGIDFGATPSIPDVYRGLVLDEFQKEAILEIERGNSVIVAAPTGAGKTLIAEYLIEKHLEAGAAIVFTAPIKAITSQKFRDFRARFGDLVGILTGDVVINRDAPVLMMTTEIYRNMLLEDSHYVDFVNYVIFDEVHYLSDIERGTVWEESIIFSPEKVRFLCLSATVPNAEEFAAWITRIKGHPARVIRYGTRPVPLTHRIFVPGVNTELSIGEIGQARGLFPQESGKNRRRDTRNRRHTNHLDLVRHLSVKGELPAIMFLFSRARCFDYAKEAARVFDFTTSQEKTKIQAIFDGIVKDPTVRGLERAQKILGFLLRGIGVHNAGLFPSVKEAVEVMFCEHLLKVVYCTETFALGINMPARAVAFDSLEKYDGIDFRFLKTREYFQMAGRAGRRGMDREGFVYSIVDPRVTETDEVVKVIEGEVEPLESQFSLSYNTVLNLVRLKEQEKIDRVLSNNFGQFQLDTRIRGFRRELTDLDSWWTGGHCRRPKKVGTSEFGKYATHHRKVMDWSEQVMAEIRTQKKKNVRKLIKKHKGDVNKRLGGLPCSECSSFQECLSEYPIKTARRRALTRVVSGYAEQVHLSEYRRRIDFLQEMGYIDDAMDLTSRGHFASLIHGYEITMTELFLEGVFDEFEPAEINALISGVIYERRKNDMVNLKNIPRWLFSRFADLSRMVDDIKEIEGEYKLKTIESLDFTMAPIAYFWSQGGEFDEIFDYTNMEEGDVIRTLRRVIDVMRQVTTAITDLPALSDKLRSCIKLMKRSIVDPEYDY